eukprot:TRINITY_DN6824_c0_g1_i1.p1 TRINITY_DN6824_c0_g1~~TRINITY_DN6824_c0_g1_i1.p1  ORF type:complete len:106 (+),score=37.47 TRINITY_DN6824_c0_g1_i1:107-424(+)
MDSVSTKLAFAAVKSSASKAYGDAKTSLGFQEEHKSWFNEEESRERPPPIEEEQKPKKPSKQRIKAAKQRDQIRDKYNIKKKDEEHSLLGDEATQKSESGCCIIL